MTHKAALSICGITNNLKKHFSGNNFPTSLLHAHSYQPPPNSCTRPNYRWIINICADYIFCKVSDTHNFQRNIDTNLAIMSNLSIATPSLRELPDNTHEHYQPTMVPAPDPNTGSSTLRAEHQEPTHHLGDSNVSELS